MSMNYLTCLDTNTPNLLNVFDTSVAPTLLFYSYLPLAILALIIGLFVFTKSRKDSISALLLTLTFLFFVNILNEILQWIAVPVPLIHFGWEMSTLLHTLIILVSVLLITQFLKIKNDHLKILFLILAPVLGLMFTTYNMIDFDLSECIANYGQLWYYIYFIEVMALVYVLSLIINKLRHTPNKLEKQKTLYFGVGSLIFLSMFILTNILGDYTLVYEINLIGPVGMLGFIIFLAISIVKFRTFHIKLLAPQALVFALIFLNFAILFIRSIENVRIVMMITIVISSILGYMMIKAVKQVDQQREALDRANRQQTNLLHFISHQVKGFFTKSRNAFAGLLEGDYGPIPETARHIIQEGFDSDNRGVQTVQEILNAANLKTGKTTYSMSDVNIVNIIKDIISLLKPSSDKKSLQVNFNPSVQSLIMKVDTAQITQAFKNLIDNSIKYTPAGKIDITLDVRDEQKQVVIKIIDTGVGIHAEDMPRLFSEGGRGKESLKINVDSTGYGLYIVKNIIEAHGGTVTASSEGEGKGSVFTVVLPMK